MIGVGSSLRSGDVDRLVELLGPVEGIRTVVLTGAPGAGKSTTLDAFGRALLDRGVDTRRVIADDLGRGSPFGVITDLLGLDRIYPPRPDTLDHVLAALETQCTSGPLALCVDDAHRADPDSLDVLGKLSNLVRDLPVVIALTRRTLPERAALSALMRRSDVVAVAVTGLDDEAVAGLVRSRYGAPPGRRLCALIDATGGNPFQIRELLDELDRCAAVTVEAGEVRVDDREFAVSTSVEAGVRAHLGLVDRRARELLQIVAVWGKAIDLATVAEILGTTPAAVVGPAQLAVEASVLRWTDEQQLTFAHDLYRDVLLGDLEPPVRRTLHVAGAVSLRRRGAGAPLIARHTADAGDPEAVAVLRAAAADLEHAPLQASELLAVAAERVGADSVDADAIAIERAGALAISGQVEAAERLARERLDHSTDPATRAALRSLIVFSLISAAQVDAALDEINASIARAPAPEARDALGDVRRWVTLLAGRQTLLGPPASVARSPSGLVTDALELFLIGRPDEGYERALSALQVRTQNPPHPWSGSPTAPVWPAFLALQVFGPRRARELSLEARREAQKGGMLWLTPYHQSVSAGINFHTVAHDTAAAPVAHARALAPAARLVAAVAADSAREAAAAALDYRAIGNVPGEMAAWEEAACLTAAAGAAEEARTVAARCTALAAPQHRLGKPDTHRAPGRRPRRPGPDQPAGRGPALHLPPHRPDPHHAHPPQTQPPFPRRARCRAVAASGSPLIFGIR